ncbi:unnamed protein product, partial [Musa banksii]
LFIGSEIRPWALPHTYHDDLLLLFCLFLPFPLLVQLICFRLLFSQILHLLLHCSLLFLLLLLVFKHRCIRLFNREKHWSQLSQPMWLDYPSCNY